MHDTKVRLSQLWLFALLNYLYADVLALFDIVGSQDPAPHLPPCWGAHLLGNRGEPEAPGKTTEIYSIHLRRRHHA